VTFEIGDDIGRQRGAIKIKDSSIIGSPELILEVGASLDVLVDDDLNVPERLALVAPINGVASHPSQIISETFFKPVAQ
jgi:hypothetical protein